MNHKISFSIVVPIFNSAPYLGELLNSLENQVPGEYSLECIFIDDGSTDESADIVNEWLSSTRVPGRLIRQQNSGVSAARNAGLQAASGTWIGFPDSDDYLSTNYLDSVAKALLSSPKDVSLVSANVVRYFEASKTYDPTHALSFKFWRGNQLVDLDESPQYIQSQAASAFFLRETIQRNDIAFTTGLHVAEDALFVANYLLASEHRSMLCVPNARYYYRKRAAGDSAVDTYKHNPDFYFGRFSEGYLPLFERASSGGSIPQWLGMMFLYDIRWFFPRELNVARKATHLTEQERQHVISLVSQALRYVEDMWILDYQVTWLGVELRCLFLALKGSRLPTAGTVRVIAADARCTEIRYLFTGDLPVEEVHTPTKTLTPFASKTKALDYFDQTVLYERIIRVPTAEQFSIALDQIEQTIVPKHYRLPRYSATKWNLKLTQPPTPLPAPRDVERPLTRRLAGRLRREAASWAPRLFQSSPVFQPGMDLREKRHTKLVQVLAQTPQNRRRFSGAWVFMDRIGAANDNGEYLYWYVSEHEPEVNSWFVIRENTADWHRLKKQGARLVAYGSLEHKFLLMHADLVASSHLDVEIVNPIPERYYWNGRPWKFIYLQHGIMQHNLSIWFNRKPIDLLTTASVDEHQSIVEDYSHYDLTEDSVKLTGFPRHDAIRRLRSSASEPSKRSKILFAPTWRHTLLKPPAAPGAGRDLITGLENTEFGRNWFELLNSSQLHGLARETNTEIVFLPHPNFRNKIPQELLSENVTLLDSVDNLHELLVQCRTVVTDYSSIFFDAAVAGAQTAYFQFDRHEFLSGGHTYVPGYWSYENHGLGPIGETSSAMVDILREQLLNPDGETARFYAERARQTMPKIDGGSSARIVKLIRELQLAPA